MNKNFKTLIATTLLLGSFSTMAFAKNHISSNVWKETSGKLNRSSGWVNIVNDKGSGVYHTTTAQFESVFGSVYATSGRQPGYGMVHATSDYTSKSGVARVYYSY